MKIYPPVEGFTQREMQLGQWALYTDVKCSNPECGKEQSLATAGGIGGPCCKCGERCF